MRAGARTRPVADVTEAPPLVSVIVPAWNVAGLVGAAIDSLKAQTLGDFEALVVDDGSTDGSGEAAQKAIAGDPRFRVIRQDNRGLSGARNTGLAQARGAFLAFLDGDDAFDPRFLEVMHRRLTETGADWAACAIALVFPDGSQVAHPAMHASPDMPAKTVVPMDLATEVMRHFPSAWNKLYRRDFFGDQTYPEGIWFEDHEVFWSLAARRRPMAYCPAPLYRHRRDRPGQITAADDDRVFDLIGVLERLQAAIARGGWPDGAAAFDRLATRLVHERAMVILDPARRKRFLRAVRDLFQRLGCSYRPEWDPEISRGLGLALAGTLPLSVLLLPRDAEDLERQQAALATQGMADFEVFVAPPPGVAVPAGMTALPSGTTAAGFAQAARGRYALISGPGERPSRDGLMRLVSLAEQTGAELAFGGFERATRGYHDGWTDNRVAAEDLTTLPTFGAAITLGPLQALRLYPSLANRIASRDTLARLGDLPLLADVASVQALVMALAMEARSAGFTRLPVAFAPDTPDAPTPCAILARRCAALTLRDDSGLPRGWRGTLFWRLCDLTRPANAGVGYWLGALRLALHHGFLRGAPEARPEHGLPRWVRALLPR